MKKVLLIIFGLILSVAVFAQRGSIYTVDADTLNGAETVNFAISTFNGSYQSVSVTAKCTQVGGTSDGTLTLYGSNDNTNWVFVNGVGAGVLTASPKASITGADLNQLTITNGLIANWVLNGSPYKYLRVAGVGTSGDSTLINITYVYK